jgi:hypothetical protein
VIAMRFDCTEIGDIMSEIAAYGTAVTVEALPVVIDEAAGSVPDAAPKWPQPGNNAKDAMEASPKF